MQPHGAVRSCSADHIEAVLPPLYSGCTARQGKANKMLHEAPEFLLAALYANMPGELGHQIVHM